MGDISSNHHRLGAFVSVQKNKRHCNQYKYEPKVSAHATTLLEQNNKYYQQLQVAQDAVWLGELYTVSGTCVFRGRKLVDHLEQHVVKLGGQGLELCLVSFPLAQHTLSGKARDCISQGLQTRVEGVAFARQKNQKQLRTFVILKQLADHILHLILLLHKMSPKFRVWLWGEVDAVMLSLALPLLV